MNRVGFVAQEYGQKKPGDPGALLTLRSGQEVKDLLFRLIPSAVIAGKIPDEDGEPLAEIQVSAVRQVYSDLTRVSGEGKDCYVKDVQHAGASA